MTYVLSHHRCEMADDDQPQLDLIKCAVSMTAFFISKLRMDSMRWLKAIETTSMTFFVIRFLPKTVIFHL